MLKEDWSKRSGKKRKRRVSRKDFLRRYRENESTESGESSDEVVWSDGEDGEDRRGEGCMPGGGVGGIISGGGMGGGTGRRTGGSGITGGVGLSLEKLLSGGFMSNTQGHSL